MTPAVCRIDVTPPADYPALVARAATDVWSADDLAEYNREGSWLHNIFVAPRAYALHPSIIDIDEIKWKNWPWKLTKVSVSKWQKNPYWERVAGAPTECSTDYQSGYIALNYRTSTADTLLMTVRRLPIVDLISDADIPEIKQSYHDYFINGVLWQMYSKQDSQAFDMKKADQYKADFLSDLDEIKQQEVIYDQRLKANTPMTAFL
jgi:hypothetical protein